jgi:hypothetical protein
MFNPKGFTLKKLKIFSYFINLPIYIRTYLVPPTYLNTDFNLNPKFKNSMWDIGIMPCVTI